MNTQNTYEMVIILTPVLNEEDAAKGIDKYRTMLKDNACTVVEETFWGLRQLAYPIQKKTTGIYWLVEFRSETTIVNKLEVEFKRDEKVMRQLITRLDKYALDYNDRKRNGLIGKKNATKKEEAK